MFLKQEFEHTIHRMNLDLHEQLLAHYVWSKAEDAMQGKPAQEPVLLKRDTQNYRQGSVTVPGQNIGIENLRKHMRSMLESYEQNTKDTADKLKIMQESKDTKQEQEFAKQEQEFAKQEQEFAKQDYCNHLPIIDLSDIDMGTSLTKPEAQFLADTLKSILAWSENVHEQNKQVKHTLLCKLDPSDASEAMQFAYEGYKKISAIVRKQKEVQLKLGAVQRKIKLMARGK